MRGVEPDGPASAAGIAEGDLLVAAGDRVLTTVDDLSAALDTAGEQLVVTIVRGTDERTVTVSFAGTQTAPD